MMAMMIHYARTLQSTPLVPTTNSNWFKSNNNNGDGDNDVNDGDYFHNLRSAEVLQLQVYDDNDWMSLTIYTTSSNKLQQI